MGDETPSRGLAWLAALLSLALPAGAQEEGNPLARDRATEDRDIVYFLEAPETHSFRLHHDYTESKEGVGLYVNVVRKGSTASKPSAVLLDTEEYRSTETLRGEEIRKVRVDIGEQIRRDSEAVVVRFPPVGKGRSSRIRIAETYTDPGSYRLDGDVLMFDRSFGRSGNAVVLPDGWYLTGCAIPATVTETPDGRVRVFFVNPRSDEIAVKIRAKKRPAAVR